MKGRDRSISAILAVFPTRDHLNSFLEDNTNLKAVDSLVQFAYRSSVIETPDVATLDSLISKHSRSPEQCRPPGRLSFESFIEKKRDLLRINLSTRSLTNHINALLADQRVDLPKVDKSMLSRLKKEPVDTKYKQNVLRSFAFWLGYQRAELGPIWNYETLLKLCVDRKIAVHFKEGVRIGFALYSRGDTIDSEVVGWLKKKIKEYTDQPQQPAQTVEWGKLRSYDLTTFYVDLPKENGSSGPASYQICLTKAIALAYQISISWALCKYSTKNRFLPIGIVAGEFSSADNSLLPILNAKLPGDPVIRVSDFVRLCILFSDIRVVLCRQPLEANLFNGELLNIWWVTGVWSSLYFDFIPELLQDPVLKNEPSSMDALTRMLRLSSGNGEHSSIEPNSVSTFLKSPQNAMLGMEIAKTLFCRRRIREANEILRTVLSVYPTNLIARTFRIFFLRCVAPDAPTFEAADYFLREAVQEAEYALENCDPLPEDFFCEYGNVYISKAMLKIQHIRKGNLPHEYLESVYNDLDKAELLFEKAFVFSPTGVRSQYFLGIVRLLQAILKSFEGNLADRKRRLVMNRVAYSQVYENILCQIGLSTDDPESIMSAFFSRFKIHHDPIMLDSYRCASHVCMAISCWDVLPNPTVGLVKMTLEVLEKAIKMAKNLEKNDLYVHSLNRIYGEVIPPAEFIEQIEACILMIKKQIKIDISERQDNEVIKIDSDSPLLLTFIFDKIRG